jgi:hypothetical protein
MKKIYSIILFFSFMIGAIQPIIPVIEYHLFKESIIELFCVNRDQPETQCDGVCYLSSQIEKNDEDHSGLKNFNVDYYPVGLSFESNTDLEVYPRKFDPLASVFSDLTFEFAELHSPPPKTS